MARVYSIATSFYMLIFVTYAAALDCRDVSLGMQNHVIPDDKITASSGTAGDQARLEYTKGPSWCATGNDTNPYLQIDLRTPHIICAVATQGDHLAENWVKTFQLSSSEDGRIYDNYTEYGKIEQTFYGNVDGSGIVKQFLYKRIFAKYLRILPKMHHGAVSMRAEVYGIRIQSDNLAIKKPAEQSSTFQTGFASKAVDGNRHNVWDDNSCSHCYRKLSDGEWWRVDLGTSVLVAEVSVFTRFYGLRLWNTLFEVRIGNHISSPTANPRCGSQYGIIPADSITIVCNPPINGRYVTIRQMKPYQQLSLCEVEVYGDLETGGNNKQESVCARLPVGVSDTTVVPDNMLSSSSSYNNHTRSPAEARLLGKSSWRPRDDDSNPWLQIDLGEIYYVCAVATQGDPDSDERTKVYKINLSLNGTNWAYVKFKTSQKHKTTGNRDRSSIIKHIFPRPLFARMIRFYPVEKNRAHALRVEAYGLTMIQPVPKILSIGNRILQPKQGSYVDLVCRADGGLRIKWYYNDLDITGYSNGTVRSGAMLISNLRINYTSADDVYEKYSCGEVEDQKRNCTSLEYICQVDYGSYRKLQTRAIVHLGKTHKETKAKGKNKENKKKEKKVDKKETKKENEENENSVETNDIKNINQKKSFSLELVVIIAVAAPLSLIIILSIAFIIWRRKLRTTKRSLDITTIDKKGERCQNKQEQQELDAIGNIDIKICPDPISVDQFDDYMNQNRKDNYKQLALQFEQLEKIRQFPCSVAEKPSNKLKNRYLNIVPYDNSRVVLEKIDGDEDSDYINASYIRGFDGQTVSYISCQGPVRRTIVDFWRMIWQEKTSVIVMLTDLQEEGKIKCLKYWPESTDTYFDMTVVLQSTDVFADYLIRKFKITKIQTSDTRIVFQYHFTAWADMEIPDPTALLSFRNRIVTDTELLMQSPWVVHCSAGVGRTGAFVAIDAMLKQAQEKKTIDVFHYIKTMREDRPCMVQKEEQYLFIYTAIHENLAGGYTDIRAGYLKKAMKKLAAIDKKGNISGFEMEFKNLLNFCPAPIEDNITFGSKTCNIKKNRFQHVLPLDETRVVLQVGEKEVKEKEDEDDDDEEPSYINASHAKGYRKKYAYILTQTPLANTIADFWKMIYDRRLRTIVMLNRLQEGNMIYPKYWPTVGWCQYGNITVETVSEEIQGGVASRTFHLVHKTDESEDNVHEVAHFQHLDWGEGSVPKREITVLDLVRKIQLSQLQSNNTAIVVQCSNGVSRSGTFCAILSLLDRVKTEEMVDVFQTVKVIRKSRPGAVGSALQYRFCFEVVMAYLKSFSEYSNFNT